MFKKYFIGILVVSAVLGFVLMKSFQPVAKTDHETLVIGVQSGYPPFEFMDAKGNIVGFDIDLANHIAKKLGKTLIIEDMEFEGEIISLKQGKIDLIMSGMNITHSRLKEILMVPYHGEGATNLSLIFWNGIPQGVNTIEDIRLLSNCTVSVETGAVPEIFMERYQGIDVRSFQCAFAALMDVKLGKSTANLVEQDVAEYLQKRHPEIKILNIPVPKEDTSLGFGIGIKKGNQALFDQIQQIILELKSSGELKELENKWFKGGE